MLLFLANFTPTNKKFDRMNSEIKLELPKDSLKYGINHQNVENLHPIELKLKIVLNNLIKLGRRKTNQIKKFLFSKNVWKYNACKT
jgi:hypothetical protein